MRYPSDAHKPRADHTKGEADGTEEIGEDELAEDHEHSPGDDGGDGDD